MVVKVCGIKTKENVQMLSEEHIDMVGLNFYPPSVRYVDQHMPPSAYDSLGYGIASVGVFVNESRKKLDQIAQTYQLEYIQLHGDESLSYCEAIAKDYKLIKVFRIQEEIDWDLVAQYHFADYFIFDTATVKYGGSGRKFDWQLLEAYRGPVPFLLSGGIGPSDAVAIKTYMHPHFAGIDINSKFESSPGIKSQNILMPFLKAIDNP